MIHSTAGRNSLCCECHIKSLCLDLWSSSLPAWEERRLFQTRRCSVCIKHQRSSIFRISLQLSSGQHEIWKFHHVTGFFGKLNLGTFVQTLMEDVQWGSMSSNLRSSTWKPTSEFHHNFHFQHLRDLTFLTYHTCCPFSSTFRANPHWTCSSCLI